MEITENLIQNPTPSGSPPVKKPKSKKIWFILAGIILLLIVVYFVGTYFLKNYQYNYLIDEATQYLSQNNYSEAIKTIDEAIDIYPDKGKAYEIKLNAAVRSGNSDLIIETSQKLGEIGSNEYGIPINASNIASQANAMQTIDIDILKNISAENVGQDEDMHELYERVLLKGIVALNHVHSMDIKDAYGFSAYNATRDERITSIINGDLFITYDSKLQTRTSDGTLSLDQTLNTDTRKLEYSIVEKRVGKKGTAEETEKGGKTPYKRTTDYDYGPELSDILYPFLNAEEYAVTEDGNNYLIIAKMDYEDFSGTDYMSYYTYAIYQEIDDAMFADDVYVRMALDKNSGLPSALYIDLFEFMDLPESKDVIEDFSFTAERVYSDYEVLY